jgi:solute carrier family 35, member E1
MKINVRFWFIIWRVYVVMLCKYAGFMGAMISNLAFVFRNIFSKKGMKGKSVSGMNYYACLSIMSLLILTPFAIAVEGPKLWAAGWQKAVSQIGPNFVW